MSTQQRRKMTAGYWLSSTTPSHDARSSWCWTREICSRGPCAPFVYTTTCPMGSMGRSVPPCSLGSRKAPRPPLAMVLVGLYALACSFFVSSTDEYLNEYFLFLFFFCPRNLFSTISVEVISMGSLEDVEDKLASDSRLLCMCMPGTHIL